MSQNKIELTDQDDLWQIDHPPELERVMVYVQFDRPNMPKIMIGWHDASRGWRWEGGEFSGEVTHWRPLPVGPTGPDPIWEVDF